MPAERSGDGAFKIKNRRTLKSGVALRLSLQSIFALGQVLDCKLLHHLRPVVAAGEQDAAAVEKAAFSILQFYPPDDVPFF